LFKTELRNITTLQKQSKKLFWKIIVFRRNIDKETNEQTDKPVQD
jgi:hypothetical protein